MGSDLGFVCLLVTGFLPTAAAFLRARYFFRFPRRSAQLLMTLPALAAMFGVLPAQWFIEDTLKLPGDFGSILFIIQYAVAGVVFFWKLTIEQRAIPPEDLARLADLNKRW